MRALSGRLGMTLGDIFADQMFSCRKLNGPLKYNVFLNFESIVKLVVVQIARRFISGGAPSGLPHELPKTLSGEIAEMVS
jgi:hypothetical protein